MKYQIKITSCIMAMYISNLAYKLTSSGYTIPNKSTHTGKPSFWERRLKTFPTHSAKIKKSAYAGLCRLT